MTLNANQVSGKINVVHRTLRRLRGELISDSSSRQAQSDAE